MKLLEKSHLFPIDIHTKELKFDVFLLTIKWFFFCLKSILRISYFIQNEKDIYSD